MTAGARGLVPPRRPAILGCRFIGLAVCLMLRPPAGPRSAQAQLWPATPDDRHGVVATNTSGYQHPTEPMQGPVYFDALGMRWWYNYLQDSQPGRVFPGYHKLYMYWRATMSRTATQIQQDAAAAAAAYPGETIWWAMSNEPNDRGQANQSAVDFAAIYYHFHRNLKLGDPGCRIMGPSVLNWDFLSTSVFQRGRDWYAEFRNAWYANPASRAYGEENYGVSYPPQDAFNFHAYDLRGVQGTPYEPEDWRYSRDQILQVRQAIQDYPEVLEKRIWLTEFGALRAATMADNVVLTRQLVGWMRDQLDITRWFWFSIHSDQNWSDTTPPRLELLDAAGQPTLLGAAARELALLPREVKVDPVNGHYAGDPVVPYVRGGFGASAAIRDRGGDGPWFDLPEGAVIQPQTMRGRRISAIDGHLIRKVVFRFSTNYDNTRVRLNIDAIDARGQTRQAWTLNQFGSHTGDVELTFSSNDGISSLGVGLMAVSGFSYTYPSGQWFGSVHHLVVFSEPDRRPPPADLDGDMDVDQSDFGLFQACYSGPGIAQDDPGCRAADLDTDDDVDQDDFAVFQRCISGPGRPADPLCAE